MLSLGAGTSAYGMVAVGSPQVGLSYDLVCVDPATGELISRTRVVYEEGQVAAPVVTGADVAQMAFATLTAPTPAFETSPPADRAQVVGVRTWIWLTSASSPLRATASVGGVSATVTATPRALRVDPGDGSPAFTCADAAVAYDPARPDRQPGCSHLYQRRSTSDAAPDGTYTMTVSITYDVTWTATTGEGGALTPLQATSPRPLLVREIQAVIN